MSPPSEPPSPPHIKRKLVLPPRRVAALLGLAALPIASVSGAFSARDELTAAQGALTMRVRYPARTLFHADESLEVELTADRGCKHAVVTGLSEYLRSYRDVRLVPGSAGADRLFDGALPARETVLVRIDGLTDDVGAARATLSFDCDGVPGPRIALRTVVFP